MQVLLGVLAGFAALLALFFFLSSGPRDVEVDGGLADKAAAVAPEPAPEPAPVAAPAPKSVVPRVPDSGYDPVSDDQIADDAAAAGMTSRTPSPKGE